jgi:hypothetical protein
MGEWRYSSIFLDVDSRRRWVVNLTPRPFYPRVKPRRTGWATELVWTLSRREKSCTACNWTRAVQSIARHYTDWAIPTSGEDARRQRIQQYTNATMSNLPRKFIVYIQHVLQAYINILPEKETKLATFQKPRKVPSLQGSHRPVSLLQIIQQGS